jgi:SOS-response transcriptional repressor LexA
MELLNQIILLDQELDKVLLGEGNTQAIKGLESIYNKIIPCFHDLEAASQCRKLYQNLPGDYSIKEQSEEELESARISLMAIQSFIMTWDELDEKHTISQGDYCSNVHDSIKGLSKLLRVKNSNQYKEWVKQLMDEVYVSDLDLEQQENSPNLKDNASEYSKYYQIFTNQTDADPITEVTIKNLISLSEKLIEIKEKMEFNQPEDVAKLFKYLKQNGNNCRAPIDMLTLEVLDWMADKGQESYFYVGDTRISNRR